MNSWHQTHWLPMRVEPDSLFPCMDQHSAVSGVCRDTFSHTHIQSMCTTSGVTFPAHLVIIVRASLDHCCRCLLIFLHSGANIKCLYCYIELFSGAVTSAHEACTVSALLPSLGQFLSPNRHFFCIF